MSELFNLSDSLNIQKQYLHDLGRYVANSSTFATDAAKNLNDLEEDLNNLYNAYSQANINSQYIIDHQNDMAMIVNEETRRLEEKKTQIDNKMFEANRMIYLNENYRKRQNAINNILLTIVISVIFFIVIIYLKKIFPIIPDIIINLLIILLFSVAMIMIVKMITKLYIIRDDFDYDKIKLPPPPILNKNNESSSNNNLNVNSSDLLSYISLNQCIGASCCTKPSIWDVGSGTCVVPNPDPADPNTLLDLTAQTPNTYISPTSCTTAGKKVCGMTCIDRQNNCNTNEGFEVLPPYSLYKTLYN